jgi:predicted nucleotidyltransferase
MALSSLKKAVLKTLAYHSLFNYPLEKKQIKNFLIKYSLKNRKEKSDLKTVLASLKKEKKIGEKNGFYFLKGNRKTVKIREKRKKESKNKLKTANNIVSVFNKISFVKGIAVTGALAMENISENDDIDLFVITKKNTLWLTRLLILAILAATGKRPKITKNKKDIKDKICVNLFLEEDCLKLKKDKQNLFIAHEIAQIKVLLNKEYVFNKFFQENNWIEEYLPNALNIQAKGKLKEEIIKAEKRKTSKIISFLNNFAFKLQKNIIEKKKTKIEIDKHKAFLVNQNQGKLILKNYKKQTNNLF